MSEEFVERRAHPDGFERMEREHQEMRTQLDSISHSVNEIAKAFVDQNYGLHHTHHEIEINAKQKAVDFWEKVKLAVTISIAVAIVAFISKAIWTSVLIGPVK